MPALKLNGQKDLVYISLTAGHFARWRAGDPQIWCSLSFQPAENRSL